MNTRKDQYTLLAALWDEIEGMGSLIFSKVRALEESQEDPYQFYFAHPNRMRNSRRARRAKLRIVQNKLLS